MGAVALVNDQQIHYAKLLAESNLLPKQYQGKPANVLYAISYAEMLGLPPMAAITGIHVIEGKPSASAGLISALVRRAGHRLRVTGNDEVAVAEIVRSDDPDYTFRSEWTLARARQAELIGKGTWQKYPAAMLKARAITEVARDACEEALSGMHYTPEELGADVDADGMPVSVTTTLAPEPVDRDELAKAIEAAATDDDLRALWADTRDHEDLRARLLERLKEVRPPEADIVDAEIVDDPAVEVADQPAPDDDSEARPVGPSATQAQLRAVSAAMNALGVSRREDRITIAMVLLGGGLQMDSTGDLTKAQASSLINILKRMQALPEPEAALDAVLILGEPTSEEVAQTLTDLETSAQGMDERGRATNA